MARFKRTRYNVNRQGRVTSQNGMSFRKALKTQKVNAGGNVNKRLLDIIQNAQSKKALGKLELAKGMAQNIPAMEKRKAERTKAAAKILTTSAVMRGVDKISQNVTNPSLKVAFGLDEGTQDTVKGLGNSLDALTSWIKPKGNK